MEGLEGLEIVDGKVEGDGFCCLWDRFCSFTEFLERDPEEKCLLSLILELDCFPSCFKADFPFFPWQIMVLLSIDSCWPVGVEVFHNFSFEDPEDNWSFLSFSLFLCCIDLDGCFNSQRGFLLKCIFF